MRQYQPFSVFYLILVIELIQSSSGHPHCNDKKVFENIVYLCNAYKGSYLSVKRDTNFAGYDNGIDRSWTGLNPQNEYVSGPTPWQTQQQPFPPGYHVNNYGTFQNPQQSSPTNPFYPGEPNSNLMPMGSPSSGGEPREEPNPFQFRRHNLQPTPLPNEPEDFASFNKWYLNPVYAGADGQSPLERWRRKGPGGAYVRALTDFVHNKCCVNGCPFPEAYWKLDEQANICGMR